MDDKQFEKRMELLKKSYNRMEPQLDPEAVFAQIEAENATQKAQETVTTQKPPSRWQKPAIWIASIASVLLLSVLVSSYVINQPESINGKKDVSQKEKQEVGIQEWIENITKKYNSKKEQIRRELKVSIDELNAFEFIKEADYMLDFYTKRSSHVKEEDVQILKFNEESILNKLMTPRRALEAIDEYNNLTFDESLEIYRLYEKTALELEDFYSGLLKPYESLLKKSKDINAYPSDLKIIIEAANNQFMELKENEEGAFYFKATPIYGEFSPPNINKLHPDTFGYFEYLEKGQLLLADDLRYTREETAKSLKIMERTLLADVNADSPTYKVLRQNFENTWLVLMKGTASYPALTKNGEPHKDYMDFLQKVANGNYGEVMKKTASTILNELQQDNRSDTLTQLSAYDIWTIVLQTREETAGFINDSDFTIVSIDEPQIKSVYEQYKKSDNEAFINQLSPLNMVSLYLFAITIGDESLRKAILWPETNINTSSLDKVKSLDIFSQLGEYDGIYPMVAARVSGEYQDMYGRQFLIKLAKNKEGNYRITGIID
ncbi:hypothetical protein ACIQGW_04760 [Lysinibacillus xylanilyticus]|uniref:hypothetical protein n=1 Tax=Lysinibacillus xylanilyticus TaxID=582475 RepID=UPI0037F85E19